MFVPWHDDEYCKFQFVISGNQVQSFPREALLNSSVVTIQLISSSTCFVLLASAAIKILEHQERQDKKEAEGCLKNCWFCFPRAQVSSVLAHVVRHCVQW